MHTILQDVRYALRQFRRSPVFTATALITLALGIGGTTAIFTLVNAVMLRSLPVADPARLYRIGEGLDCCMEGAPQGNWSLYSYNLFKRLKEATPEFEQLAAFKANTLQFSVRRSSTDREAKPLRSEYVSGNYFDTFGIRPLAGRLFRNDDDRAAAPPVAVLSYRTWEQDYGSDPSVIGANFIIEGHPFTIVGISPPGFFGETLRSDPPQLWVPIEQEPLIGGPGSVLHQPFLAWLRTIGRLRPGANVEGMSARLTGVIRRWIKNEGGYPAEFMSEIEKQIPKQQVKVIPAGAGVEEMQSYYTKSLQILLSVCGLVLLIACANVANLMLARGVARRSNTSIRMALGASRTRLIRQMLTESVLLSILGGVLGIFLAYFGASLIIGLTFHRASFIPISASPSPLVLGFSFAVSFLSGVLFGTAPAWFASKTEPVEALRGLNRTTVESSSLPQKSLLVFQAALSLVLLAGATLLTRSLNNIEKVDFGFKTEDRITVAVHNPPPSYSPEQLRTLYVQLRERLRAIPGVNEAALALYTPLQDNWGELVYPEGSKSAKLDMNQVASWDRVSPGYFESLGQTLMQGRSITAGDNEHSRNVAVVNEAFVKRFFPGTNPIGHHFGLDLIAYANTFEIVGVVRDAQYWGATEKIRPMFFLPLAQSVQYHQTMMDQIDSRSHFIEGAILRVNPNTPGLTEAIHTAFADVDPNLAVLRMQPLREQIDAGFDQRRSVARLTSLFGILALMLAAVGLYGITAYTVARRTNEIGVRMALGADRISVVKLVLSGAFWQILIGLLIGVPAAIGAGKLLSSELFQVPWWDPIALSISIALLSMAAFIASVIPAHRASAIDPMNALRSE